MSDWVWIVTFLAAIGCPEEARRWAAYLVGWTAWNHVRTVASLAAAVLLTFALIEAGGAT